MRTTVLLAALGTIVWGAGNPPSRIVGKTIWNGQVVDYEVVDGRMVVGGDLSIGKYEQAAASHKVDSESNVNTWVHSALWPSGVVPYAVDPAIPNQDRITTAVNQWNTRTPIRFVPRTAEATYLYFARNTTLGSCFTNLSMAGGEQFVQVIDSCDAGTIAHEMGHVIGLAHEHQRADRDYYVQIFGSLLEKVRLSDLNLAPGGSVPFGAYDYGSLMHYGRYYTLKYSTLSTMESIPAGLVMGTTDLLSDGDIDQINRMYGATPTAITISTNPPGLQVIVDSQTITAPQSFNWTKGSQHKVDVPSTPQFLPTETSATRYIPGRWNDNQPQAHTITATPNITVYSHSFIQQFQVQTGAAASGGGTVSISPPSDDGFYTNNTTVTVTATPDSGSNFLVWGPSGILGQYNGYSDNPSTFPVKSPVTYNATFVPAGTPTYTVTTDPPDLPVIVDNNTPVAPRTFTWVPGSVHTISARPVINNQWTTIRKVFTGWSDGGDTTHTVTADGMPTTYTASYKLQYKLTTQFSGSGSITVSPDSDDGFYDAGTVVQITATPASGFKLASWTGDLQGQDESQSLVMNDEMVVTAAFTKPLTITAPNIVNAASSQYSSLSPGEIVTITGLEIGAAQSTSFQVDASGRVMTNLAGTRVIFDGVAAPVLYTSLNSITAIVPYGIAGQATTTVQVERSGTRSNSVKMNVALSAPGIFSVDNSGIRSGSIFNEDFTLNSSANPTTAGSIVFFFATGEGLTTPASIDGKLAIGPLPKPTQSVALLFAGPAGVTTPASDIIYAAAAAGQPAGVLELIVRIPAGVPTGNVPISLIVGGQRSPDWLTIAIQ